MVRTALNGCLAARTALAALIVSSAFEATNSRADEPGGTPLAAAAVAAAAGAGDALTTPDSVQKIASYTLNARLDEVAHSIHGDGTLTWVNAARVPTSELYFHLYLNAFEHAQTLFNRSPFTHARSGRMTQRWGRITLTKLLVREFGGVDLLAQLEPHTPGDPQDRTDRRLPLPEPVAPGQRLTIDIEWDSVLPAIVERTGVSRDFHFVGQWFPKIARLEPDGSWAHFPFHPHAEFYADFGDYDVTLDVPEGMVVGATGRRVSESVEQGRRRIRQHAVGVHDFAWTAWAGFERQEERIGSVDVHLLYPPGNTLNAERTLGALRSALPDFDGRYGKYPYPDLTVVHPPSHAASAGGMEYPTLITTGGPWHQPLWSRAVELVTIHELGHQWFYGLIASAEPRWPFLDEGLNSYAETLSAEELFGPGSAGSVGGLVLSVTALHRAVMRLGPHDGPIARPAREFADFDELGALVYSRTALLFRTVANAYGPEKMEEALRLYAARYRFEHPGPEELLQTLEEVLGAGAAANARGALFDGHGVNYSVRDLRSVRRALESAPGAVATAGAGPESLAPAGGGPFESRVVIHRQGELRFPVSVLLLTSHGERILHRWEGHGRDEVITHVGAAPVVSVRLDPEDALLIDEDLLDNAFRAGEAPAPLDTWERSLYFFQLLLGWLAP